MKFLGGVVAGVSLVIGWVIYVIAIEPELVAVEEYKRRLQEAKDEEAARKEAEDFRNAFHARRDEERKRILTEMARIDARNSN